MNPAYPCKVHAYDSCGAQVERLYPGMTYRELVAKEVLIECIRLVGRLHQEDAVHAAHTAAYAADRLIAELATSRAGNGNGGNP